MKRAGRLLWMAVACAAALMLAGNARADDVLERQLDQLVLLGYDQPDQALLRLERLSAKIAGSPKNLRALLFAQAQIEAMRGNGAPKARALADRLRAQSSDSGQADLVGAIVAETAFQLDTAGALASRALSAMEPACAPAADIPAACDYRSVWLALRMSKRFQDYTGAYAHADALSLRALNLAERANDKYRLAVTLGAKAVALARQDDQAEADRVLARAHGLAEGSPATLVQVLMAEALVSDMRNRVDDSLRVRSKAAKLADQLGAVRAAARQRVNLSDTYLRLARPNDARRVALLALPVVQSFQDRRLERTLRLNLAMAYIALGQVAPALSEMNKGLALGEPGKAVDRQALELRELGEAMARAGQYKQALALYHEERALSAEARKIQRESALRELSLKYDSVNKQADLDLLQREKVLQRESLANHQLARQAWMAVLLLLSLSVVLAVIMVRRVRRTNRDLAASHALLRAQSERDPLTDLANRRHFMAVMQSQGPGHFEGALLMVDIDHFKHVNDHHGHAGGDVVICEVVRRINEAVRVKDLVVRWGGEEFLIFAPNVPTDQLEMMAQRVLVNVCAKPVHLPTGTLDISVSIGFASFPLPPHRVPLRWEQAVNLVDMALYTAKSQGRNRAIGITHVEVQDAGHLQEIEADFERARQNGLVELHQILGPGQTTSSMALASV